MTDPTYDKLRKIMWETAYPGEPMYEPATSEIRSMYETVDHLLDAIWPEIVELLAKNLEYEHALEHTADIGTHSKMSVRYCEQCASLAQSALDGVNRADFREMITDP